MLQLFYKKSSFIILFLLVFFSFNSEILLASGWKSLGPLGGTPWSIAFSPTFEQDGTIFIGTNKGVYKSVDKGKSWSQATKGIGRKLVPTIAISPNYTNDQTLFVGTSRGELFVTYNAGESWVMVFKGPEIRSNSSKTPSSLEAIAISPNYSNDGTVFIGVFGAYIYRSVDRGASWLQFKKGLDSKYVLALGISPNYSNDQTLFAGTIDKGVFISTNSGLTWEFTGNGLPDKFIQKIVLSTDYSNDGTVFLAMPGEGLYLSRNYGRSWSKSENGLDNAYVRTIDLSNNYYNDKTIYIGASFGMIFKSENAGESWTRVNDTKKEEVYGRNLQDKQIRSLALSPNFNDDGMIFSGTSAGLFSSNDRGIKWDKVTEGLTVSTIRTITVSPNFVNDGTVFAGTNNTGIFKSTNGGETWMQANSGLKDLKMWMLDISPNYSNDGIVFVTGKSGLYKSVDRGDSWNYISIGSEVGERVIQAIDISNNFAQDFTLFIATSLGIFKSENGGQTWNNLSETYIKSRILEISTSPNFAEDQTILTGTLGDFLYRSIDGGNTWDKINNETLNNISVHSIDFSSEYSENGLIIIGSNLGAFKSNDFGETWISMSNGLPSSQKMISSVKISPNGTMFVGLPNEGIYKSDDSGETWDQINFGLFNDYVSVIDISPNFVNDNIIYAGTLGSGVFRSSEYKAALEPTPVPPPQTLYFSEESWNFLGYLLMVLVVAIIILLLRFRKTLLSFRSGNQISGESSWSEILKNTADKSQSNKKEDD